MDKLNVAIFGANGFIGKHLIAKLVTNTKIKQLKLFSKNVLQFPDLKTQTNIHFKSIDIKLPETYRNEIKNIDVIYYLISESVPSSTWNNPHIEIENNLKPFLVLLNNLVHLNVKKIIFTSSAGTIYGPSEKITTEKSNTNPFSPHGITKLSMENFLEYYRVNHNLNYEIFRISNVYGENQNTEKGVGIINTLLENHLANRETTIFGSGKAIRNYIYVNDVATFLNEALSLPLTNSNCFNLASSDNITVNQLIKKTEKILDIKLKIKHINQRSSDNPNIKISNFKIKQAYSNIDFTPLETGIKNTFNHLNQINKCR
jgi:UDP-glucose 4-epimerase